MMDKQLSFFDPVSTVTGQTAWSKAEGDKRLAEIWDPVRERHFARRAERARVDAGFHDRRLD